MKGGLIGYTLILAMFIAGAATMILTTQTDPIEQTVATKEGLLASSGNFNYFVLKTFNQSLEFISQRAAYDLGNNGGLMEGREVFWSFNYPQIADLKKNLEHRIERRLPSFYKKLKRSVNLDDILVVVDPGPPIEYSRYFDTRGDANLSLYDDTVRSRTFIQHEFNSRVFSSYFRLLYVGREILINDTFNSSLGDAGELSNKLNADPRFDDLNFIITASDDILFITIEHICYPPDTYCLAPLYSEETKTILDATTLDPIPYDYLRLKFKVKVEQTGATPPDCDFSIELDPTMGSVLAGDEVVPLTLVEVKKDGSSDEIVTLSATVYNKTTMSVDNSINVDIFVDSHKMPFNTFMNITTDPMFTLKGEYLVEVKGESCTPLEERFANFDLTVDPSMQFSIVVNPDPVIIVKKPGYWNTTDVDVTKIIGSDKDVHLYFDSLPPGISQTLSVNDISPDFTSVLTLTTDGSTPQGDHTITIKGIGGGSYAEKDFTLTVNPIFKFDFYFQGTGSDSLYPSQQTSDTMAVETIEGTPEPVFFTYRVTEVNLGPRPDDYLISVSFSENPSPLSPITPDRYPTMTIFTNAATPPGDYVIYVNASSTDHWVEISFDLEVLTPECMDMGTTPSPDCLVSQGFPSTPCKYWNCIAFDCIEENYNDGFVPDFNPSDGVSDCGTESCDDKCEPDAEYRNPTTPTCDITCDGIPNEGQCKSSCDTGACIYSSVWECRTNCKDTLNCEDREWCISNTCSGGTGFGCLLGGTTVTTEEKCQTTGDPVPEEQYAYTYNAICVLATNIGCAADELCTPGFPTNCCLGAETCYGTCGTVISMDRACKYLECDPDLGEVLGVNTVCTDMNNCNFVLGGGCIFTTTIDLGCATCCCLY